MNNDDFFGKAAFDIEHALGMYAFSYCIIPAEGIYDKEALAPLMSVIETCHIYLIGYTPRINFIDAVQVGSELRLKFEVLGIVHYVNFELPQGVSLKREGGLHYLEDPSGWRGWPDDNDIHLRLSIEAKTINFEVKHIGQAYGKDGSRNAIDRLLKHETLQKIALSA